MCMYIKKFYLRIKPKVTSSSKESKFLNFVYQLYIYLRAQINVLTKSMTKAKQYPEECGPPPQTGPPPGDQSLNTTQQFDLKIQICKQEAKCTMHFCLCHKRRYVSTSLSDM